MRPKDKESFIEKLTKKVETILFSGVESQLNNSVVSTRSKVNTRRNSIESIISDHNDKVKNQYKSKGKNQMDFSFNNSIVLESHNEPNKRQSRQTKTRVSVRKGKKDKKGKKDNKDKKDKGKKPKKKETESEGKCDLHCCGKNLSSTSDDTDK